MVDLPAPGGPTINVWPRSLTWRLKRNGVAPVVAAYKSAGLLAGIRAEGFSVRPAHREVIGNMSARFNVCSTTRRTFRYPSPGKLPRHASIAFTLSIRQEK